MLYDDGAATDFCICGGGSWNQSFEDTKGQLYWRVDVIVIAACLFLSRVRRTCRICLTGYRLWVLYSAKLICIVNLYHECKFMMTDHSKPRSLGAGNSRSYSWPRGQLCVSQFKLHSNLDARGWHWDLSGGFGIVEQAHLIAQGLPKGTPHPTAMSF